MAGYSRVCVAHRILKIGWGDVKQAEIVVMTAGVVGGCLRLSEKPVSIREM
jgi:hypothetical protein